MIRISDEAWRSQRYHIEVLRHGEDHWDPYPATGMRSLRFARQYARRLDPETYSAVRVIDRKTGAAHPTPHGDAEFVWTNPSTGVTHRLRLPLERVT